MATSLKDIHNKLKSRAVAQNLFFRESITFRVFLLKTVSGIRTPWFNRANTKSVNRLHIVEFNFNITNVCLLEGNFIINLLLLSVCVLQVVYVFPRSSRR